MLESYLERERKNTLKKSGKSEQRLERNVGVEQVCGGRQNGIPSRGESLCNGKEA